MIETIKRILVIIPTGKENGVSMSYLANTLEIPQREVRFLVNEVRLRKYPVCGDEHGYYYPESLDELNDYIRRICAHRDTTSQVCDSMSSIRKALTEDTIFTLKKDILLQVERGEVNGKGTD